MEQKEETVPVSHIAHDLNNILTRILNSVELLKKKVSNPEDVIPLISSIENGTYMAAEIIEDLLSESTNKIIKKKRININSLLSDLINTISIHLKDRITFNLKLESKLSFVEGRYSDYYRVFMNLIINASEAIKDRGVISIHTSNPKHQGNEPKLFEGGSSVLIKISDNGEGIDPSVMPYIFENNFTTKSKKKNSGIGLSIVKKIVDDSGGVIKVSSEKNKGTEFTLRFPTVANIKEEVESKTKLILVAEDEDILRELLAELLISYEFKVITSANGEEVIKELNNGKRPDLFIIDQKMPDMDGITCIKKIKEMKLPAPIILATGSQSDYSNEEGINNLVNRIITKPYNFEEMLNVIRDLIN
ncbi:MAG: response regulator [Ignavibacteria bacterium]|nr:response regulator [Ignavibacteria bacterium]